VVKPTRSSGGIVRAGAVRHYFGDQLVAAPSSDSFT
jgi:hypothetical protein